MKIDYSSPDWPLQARRAKLFRKPKLRLRPGYEKPSRRTVRHKVIEAAMYKLYLAQGGRCANAGCNVEVKVTGTSRAHDKQLNVLLCKRCSVALGVTGRLTRILAGLAALIELQ